MVVLTGAEVQLFIMTTEKDIEISSQSDMKLFRDRLMSSWSYVS